MKALFHRMLLVLAKATDLDMAQVIQFLKVENEILRSKFSGRVPLDEKDKRRLLRFGKPLGKAIKDLISIVSPRTFQRWLKADKPADTKTPTNKPGRPKTDAEIRDLIIRIANETGFGASKVHGELKKLGLDKVSRTTVLNILRKHGLEPGPARGEGSWADFLKRHASTLWACDFLSAKVWTVRGQVDVFILFFIHVDSRRVHVAGITAHPDRPWMVQQARNLSMFFADQPVKPKMLIRDYDSKFVPEFDAILRQEGIEVKKVGPQAPNLNAYAERWVQTIRLECLDHFVVLGEEHLRHIVSTYVRYYNELRPHQSKDNLPLSQTPASRARNSSPKGIVCDEFLGGLLKHYRHAA